MSERQPIGGTVGSSPTRRLCRCAFRSLSARWRSATHEVALGAYATWLQMRFCCWWSSIWKRWSLRANPAGCGLAASALPSYIAMRDAFLAYRASIEAGAQLAGLCWSRHPPDHTHHRYSPTTGAVPPRSFLPRCVNDYVKLDKPATNIPQTAIH